LSKLLDITEVADILGVDTKTLRRWDNSGKLKAIRTFGNHRRYKSEDIDALINNETIQHVERNVFVYCRVSTRKQMESGNLQRQKERLVDYCNIKQYMILDIFEETASGINDSRRELIKMFRRLNEVNTIVVEYSDRLARFGFNYLKEFAKSFDVEIEMIEQKKKLEPNEEMVQDLVSVVTCFSARLYGARGGRKIKKTLEELEKERQGEDIENNSKSNVD